MNKQKFDVGEKVIVKANGLEQRAIIKEHKEIEEWQ